MIKTLLPSVLVALFAGFLLGRYGVPSDQKEEAQEGREFAALAASGKLNRGSDPVDSLPHSDFKKPPGIGAGKSEVRVDDVLAKEKKEIEQRREKFRNKLGERVEKYVGRYQEKIVDQLALDEAEQLSLQELFEELDFDTGVAWSFSSEGNDQGLTQKAFEGKLLGLLDDEQKVIFQEWSQSQRDAKLESLSLAQTGRVGEMVSVSETQQQQVYDILAEELQEDLGDQYEKNSYAKVLSAEAFGGREYDDFKVSKLLGSKEWSQAENRSELMKEVVQAEVERRVERFTPIFESDQLKFYQEELEQQAEAVLDMMSHVIEVNKKEK